MNALNYLCKPINVRFFLLIVYLHFVCIIRHSTSGKRALTSGCLWLKVIRHIKFYKRMVALLDREYTCQVRAPNIWNTFLRHIGNR